MTIMEVGSDGRVQDRHVEKLFHDLYYGSHKEDDISLKNFRVYLRELYGYKAIVPAFSVMDVLPAAAHIGIIEIGRNATGETYAARFSDWEDRKLYVFNDDLAIVIALAIVQHMRIDTANHLNSGSARKQ